MQGFKALLSKGKKPMMDMEMPAPMSPNICLDSRQFPDIKNWELGSEYTFKARYVSKNEKEDGHIHGDFEIVAAEGTPTKKAKKKDESEEAPEEMMEEGEPSEAEMDGYDDEQ